MPLTTPELLHQKRPIPYDYESPLLHNKLKLHILPLMNEIRKAFDSRAEHAPCHPRGAIPCIVGVGTLHTSQQQE